MNANKYIFTTLPLENLTSKYFYETDLYFKPRERRNHL